jgi:DNA helicase-2/ATP-dependent DNA helicase PcrA
MREDDGQEVAVEGPEEVLAALDPEQREVALASRGPVCVIAGAGTGKTRAIAHRIAYAVASGVVRPDRVLAVTFTTRAAGELRARLRSLGGPGSGMERVTARTFHAAALRQLRYFWPGTMGGRAPAVLDSKVGLLAEAARRARIWETGRGTPGPAVLRDVATEIEWAKVTRVAPAEYPAAAARSGRTPPLPPEAVARLFASYEELRAERHLADFEAVLALTVDLLASYPAVAAQVRDRYRYFVVDEYQDVNPLQKLLLDTWLGDREEVCVVGDPRQTIYSFTGATPAYLTGFPAEFPDATVLRLVRNYRSTPQVVELANRLTGRAARTAVLPASTGRPGRRPDPARNGCAVAGPALAGPGEAGPGVAGPVLEGPGVVGPGVAGPGVAGPPLAAQRPDGPDPEFAGYPDEGAEAEAVVARAAGLIAAGTPAREIAVLVRTNAQTERFERAFARAGVPCQVRGAERFFERPEVRQAMGLLRAAARADPGAGADQVGHVLSGLGFSREPPAGSGTARERWESLAALAQAAADLCTERPGTGLAGVVDELARRAAIEHAPLADGVTVASLHAAKGLEWDVVFLPGLTEGILPISYATTPAALAEERRLLYVGVTRARQRVLLSWARARTAGGQQARQPSRFLAELRPRRARAGAGGERT